MLQYSWSHNYIQNPPKLQKPASFVAFGLTPTIFNMDRSLHPFTRSVVLSEIQENMQESKAPTMQYVPLLLKKKTEPRILNTPSATEVQGIQKVLGLEPLLNSQFPIYLNALCTSESAACEVLMCVAMYNEGIQEFNATMTGVAQNLKTFVKYGICASKVACIVIVDGHRAFLSEVLKRETGGNTSTFRSFFDQQLIKATFNARSIESCSFPGQKRDDEFAHVFVHDMEFQGVEGYTLQLIFCIKHFNRRKLNTHLWFFGGFCEMIQPKYVILLDVGTAPQKKALFYLYEAMETDSNVAGCCGEIAPDYSDCWNPIVQAQAVEYKFAHIFDKALESVFGYITVLPGAFSAYRWEALQGKPLWEDYFKSLCHPELMDCFNSNIYLAEDRVLCMALVSKARKAYTLRYVKKSIAKTDVPDSLSILMAQRRRWINGSWFALIRALGSYRRINKSGHNCGRKCVLYVEMLYYYINVLISWFMVGSFFLVFAIAVRTQFNYQGEADYAAVGNYIVMSYVLLLIVLFILSLSVKPKRIENIIKAIAGIMGIFMLFTVYLMIALLFDARVSLITLLAGVATFGLFFVNILINCAILTILKGIIQFLFLIPTYINLLVIYSICNIHDCTWGNRPDELTQDEKNRIEDFEHFRARWVLIWAVCNCSFAYALNSLDKESDGNLIYLSLIAAIGFGILVIRTFFGVIYVMQEKCCKKSLTRNKQDGSSTSLQLGNDIDFRRIIDDLAETNTFIQLATELKVSVDRIRKIQTGEERPNDEEVADLMRLAGNGNRVQ